MEILFLGVGEACDSNHGNSSVLITTKRSRILLDCGFSVPHAFFKVCEDPNCLNSIWISHFHGDHFFGLPLLLLRFWEMKRTRPLQLISQQGLAKKTTAALKLAYPGFADKLSFPIEFLTLTPGMPLQCRDLTLQAARTSHSQSNYGLLINDGKHRIYYSGDGRPTPEAEKLTHGCDLVIHEGFTLDNSMHGHCSISECLQLKTKEQIKKLALIHLNRTTRKQQDEMVSNVIDGASDVFLPTEGETIILE